MSLWCRTAGMTGALLLTLTSAAFAQSALPLRAFPDVSAPASVKRVHAQDLVLIATVEAYRDPQISPVEGAVKTGEDWKQFFVQGLGVPASQVVLMQNEHVTRSDFEVELDTLLKKSTPEATVWVIFVGHGIALSRNGGEAEPFLLPYNTKVSKEFIERTSLSQVELVQRVERGRQRRSVFFFDTCFSGRDQKGKALAGAQAVVPREDLLNAGIARATKETHVFAAATGDFARALEHYPETRPAFSYLAMGGMRGWADRDRDGTVSGAELLAYVNTFPQTSRQRPALSSTANASLQMTVGVSEREPGVIEVLREGPTCKGVSKLRSAATSWQCCYPGQRWEGDQCVGTPQCMERTRLWRDPNPAGSGEMRCLTASEAASEDYDADGIPDVDDACPADFGTREQRGCRPVEQARQDRDQDGVFDDEDACPNERGPVTNRGCPVTARVEPADPTPPEAPREPRNLTGLGWMVGGGASGLVGLGMFLHGGQLRTPDDTLLQSKLESNYTRGRALRLGSLGALGVGAALAATGVLKRRGASEQRVSVDVHPQPGGAEAMVRFSF